MRWNKINFGQIQINNLLNDTLNPAGNLRQIYEEAAAETADYLARIQNLISSKTGRIEAGIRASYRVYWPTHVSFGEVDILDQVVGKYRLSKDNANPKQGTYKFKWQGRIIKAQSYWPMVFLGWGKAGGRKAYNYRVLASVYDSSSGEYKLVSPYHRSIYSGEYTVVQYIRHPGAAARNVYLVYNDAMRRFFAKTLQKKLRIYYAKYGLKIK